MLVEFVEVVQDIEDSLVEESLVGLAVTGLVMLDCYFPAESVEFLVGWEERWTSIGFSD